MLVGRYLPTEVMWSGTGYKWTSLCPQCEDHPAQRQGGRSCQVVPKDGEWLRLAGGEIFI